MTPVNRQFFPDRYPEVFRPDDPTSASRAVRRGELRRLARSLYTWNLDEPAERLIRRRWMDVAALYFPGAVIVDRSAVEGRPADDGSLFLDAGPSYTTDRSVPLPGLTFRPRRGPGPLGGDMPFGGLHRSSQARTALENMRPSRARSGVARTLSRVELEQWLDRLAVTRGEEELGLIRDEARELAPQLGLERELGALDELIGGMLGTRDAPLSSRVGRARGARSPFDAARVELFSRLHGELAEYIAPMRPEPADPQRVFAFFEAYFSNFIEGTEFEVEEAERIVFEGAIPAERPEDAHDVLGTFAVVTDAAMRARVPESADDLLAILMELNRRILEGRPGMSPGAFKTRANRAGNTTFVAPDLVVGTLKEGWAFYETLEPGFARAVFATYLVSEVHPFTDGNGRVARALLNQELSAAGECRVAIPLAYRSDYLGALRAMSRRGSAAPLPRMVDRAQRWASLVDWSDMDAAVRQLEATNALVPPDEAEAEGILLKDPD
jgi:Fic/DOC family protein